MQNKCTWRQWIFLLILNAYAECKKHRGRGRATPPPTRAAAAPGIICNNFMGINTDKRGDWEWSTSRTAAGWTCRMRINERTNGQDGGSGGCWELELLVMGFCQNMRTRALRVPSIVMKFLWACPVLCGLHSIQLSFVGCRDRQGQGCRRVGRIDRKRAAVSGLHKFITFTHSYFNKCCFASRVLHGGVLGNSG